MQVKLGGDAFATSGNSFELKCEIKQSQYVTQLS